jgi:putative CocE/NonD family hydrolase
MRRLGIIVVASLVGALLTVSTRPADGTPPPWTYFTVSDGTKIAAAVRYPAGFDPAAHDPLPVLFMMDGYAAGGSGGIDPAHFGNAYITVYASIRGTGCSGGVFNLFDRRHAEDGHEIITRHLPALPGSNGNVGIIGHSYPGLTGWMVAATNPPNLRATAISGLIDDLYRGIVYPGGVPNYGFPVLWTGIVRPGVEYMGNAGRYLDETAAGDPTCAANIATRHTDLSATTNSVLQNPVLNGLASPDDGDWWRMRSPVTWAQGIRAPIHITHQYQDEQTGPRAPLLFERIDEAVPKRLVLTNGVHSTERIAHYDRLAWLDCYVREVPSACAVAQDPNRVLVHYDTTDDTPMPAGVADFAGTDWPFPETRWTRYFLHADGTLSPTDVAGEPTRQYVHGTAGRQVTGLGNVDPQTAALTPVLGQATFVDGPDQLRYELEIPEGGEPLTIAGPINLTLTASSTAVNTDFFVGLLDVNTATGETLFLQRGLLRASHREINPDPSRSDFTPGGEMYRAWRPHHNTTTKLLTPGRPYQFEIEVFPVGHVFRPGHKLVIQISAPPPLDPLSSYAWASGMPPAVNTVHHDPVEGLAPSSILLPVVPNPAQLGPAPACGAMIGVPCFTPADRAGGP